MKQTAAVATILVVWLLCGVGWGQLADSVGSKSARPGIEFPAYLLQSIVAGKTPAGSVVRARLTMATFVNGVVIPDGALMIGTVEESAEKSAENPSRLKVRIRSIRWERQALAVNLWITRFYHRRNMKMSENLSPGSMGVFTSVGETDFDVVANRAILDDVTQSRESDGSLALASDKKDIKLDKATMYTFEGTADGSKGALAPAAE